MSKNTLREDKTCLNCRYVVENRFCPNCGQENTDTRKTFYHLFVHFFEDLTHYENAFWKTIKNLYFKPAALTKEYLSGKRLSYLAPVRLYIFISFVTFFLISVFPNDGDDLIKLNQSQSILVPDANGKMKDSIISNKKVTLSEVLAAEDLEPSQQHLSFAKKNENFLNFGYKNLRELDSMQKYGPKEDKLSDFEYNIVKKSLIVKSKYSKTEILNRFAEQAKHNFPKTLFIYMPLFAFILWLFHGKKRWYYFDHGIFTLHYFSFLLLSTLLLFFFKKLMNCFDENLITDIISFVVSGAVYIWMFYYFLPAHRRFYGETRTISFLKSTVILSINFVLIFILLLIFMLYTFINIH